MGDNLAALLLMGAGAGGVYAWSLVRWPFITCRKCDGKGKFRPEGSRRRVYRKCRKCKGLGGYLRIGRRVYNHYHQQQAKAER